jgi:DNA-binding NarL/FixJ family response regulator
MSSVLIADDHAIVRAGCVQYLAAEPGITRLGEAATGLDVLERLGTEHWDLVLLDIHMPKLSGLDALRQIVTSHPDVRVLVMSGLPEAQYARNVIRAGAHGYVSKDGTGAEMVAAVHVVLAGRRYVSTALALSMAGEPAVDSDQPLHSQLSSREFEIFCKIAVGTGVSAIASELKLSVKTVSTYRARMMEKLAFNTNADVTAYAFRNQLFR